MSFHLVDDKLSDEEKTNLRKSLSELEPLRLAKEGDESAATAGNQQSELEGDSELSDVEEYFTSSAVGVLNMEVKRVVKRNIRDLYVQDKKVDCFIHLPHIFIV